MELTNRIAWITGASSGIGRAIALAFAAKGAKLILSGRRREALEETAAATGQVCMILPFDTTDLATLPDIVHQAVGWQGRLDILVNNAGITQRALAVDTDLSVYDAVLAADLVGPIHLTQACLPHLIAHKDGQIVTISSVAGRAGVPLRTAYCAAKHGIIGYMDALRSETEIANGLKVLNVLPGSVATDIARNALTRQGERKGTSDPQIDSGLSPDACAAAIVEAIEAGSRELIFAEGIEMELARLRHSDPEALFALTAKFGAGIAKDAG